MRSPGRLLLDDEQALEGVHVSDRRLCRQRLSGDILRDGGERGFRRNMPGERPYEGTHPQGVPARLTIETADVDTDDVIDIVPQMTLCLRSRQITIPGPPSVDQLIKDLGHARSRDQHRFGSLTIEQSRK